MTSSADETVVAGIGFTFGTLDDLRPASDGDVAAATGGPVFWTPDICIPDR